MAALFAAVLLVEGGLRLAGLGYGSAPLIADPVLHHVHPPDYRFVMHDPAEEFGGHLIHYDSRGLVAAPDASVAPALSPALRLAFFGNGFTEATQVPSDQSFVGLVQRRLRARAEVRNYGTSAYSPVLYLLQWDQGVKEFHPTHVFVLLSALDIANDLGYAARARKDAQGQITAVPGPADRGWIQPLRQSYVVRFLRKVSLDLAWRWEHRGDRFQLVEQNPPITALTERTVAALATRVSASGAQLTLMVVPSKSRLQGGLYDPAVPEFSERWRRWASQRGIAFVDLVSAFRAARQPDAPLFFFRDSHFNRYGHEVVASAIVRAHPELFRP